MTRTTDLLDLWSDPEDLDLLADHALTKREWLQLTQQTALTDSDDPVRRHFARRSVQPR